MYAKIIDHPGLVRDMTSHAVLNVDTLAKDNFLKTRETKRKERERIDTLEGDVRDIKAMLKLLLEQTVRS